jgi:hypothetical protein
MSDDAPRKPSYRIHDGFRMPLGFPVEGFGSGQRYGPEPGDIFVSTYPKCGTTWAQYIVYLLVTGEDELPADRSLTEVFPHLEEVGAEVVAALPKPRLIKTHLPFARTPWSDAAKYIYVARNPFDCAVSFFHHTRGFPQHYDFADGTWDVFFECFLAGEVDFGDYFDNLLSWYRERERPNMLFLTYERMLADPAAAVRSIGLFLGGAAAEAVRDEARLRHVVDATSFSSMRRDQRRWSSARPPGMPEFVRKGIVGDFASHFSAEQARRLAAKLERLARGSGVERLWPDVLDAVKRLS